jgi:hypothetical protein
VPFDFTFLTLPGLLFRHARPSSNMTMPSEEILIVAALASLVMLKNGASMPKKAQMKTHGRRQ